MVWTLDTVTRTVKKRNVLIEKSPKTKILRIRLQMPMKKLYIHKLIHNYVESYSSKRWELFP